MTITNSSLRLVALVTGVAVALVLMGAVAVAPAQAAGLTQTQIQSIVSLLASFGADAATIANVTAALNGQATPGTGSGTGGACPALSRSLQQGSSGADVKALQVFLNGNAQTQVSVSGAGSPGSETTFFGPATVAAVKKFQTLNNVSSIGIVGPQTRAAIAAVCGGTGTPPTTPPGTIPPTGGAVTVSAGTQPANSLAVVSASRVPFTTFSLTNNSAAAVTINNITIQRVGLGVDANFSGIVLLDSNGLQIGTEKTLNSNHQANIGDSFTIGAGQTMSFTVAGNIQTDAGGADAGQVVGLQVVAVNTGATVSGSLPISGASHTINVTLTLGSVSTTTSSFDPGVASNKNIGDTSVRVSGIRFTAGSAEDLKLYSIRWRQVGTASASDIANVMTNVGGTDYPTTISSDGKYYTTIFPGGLSVAKGNSIDVYNKVDLVGSNSADRTIDFDIDRVTDVYFVGQTYGYGVAPSGTYTPWFTGYVVTIKGGQVTTIGKANEVAAQNVAVNVANQPLGGFVTDFKGEAVTVTSMIFNFNHSSSAATGNLLTNVSLVDSNGVVVAGPVDAVVNAGTSMTVTFSDTVTFPLGRKVFTLKGKIDSDVTNGETVTASTTPSGWSNPKGVTTGNSVSITTGNFTMNSMTVKAAALTVVMSTQPASQNIVAGVQNQTLGRVNLDASQSGEDVRMSSIILVQTGTIANLSSCQLYNGTTVLNTGGNVPSLAASGSETTFTFDNPLVISKGAVVGLDIKCNIAAGSTGTHIWSLTTTALTATGVTSGNSVAVTETASTGGTMTLASGTLTVSVDASSPSYTPVAAGTTGQTMSVLKLRAANETLNLQKVGLTLTLSGATKSTSAGGSTNLGINDLVQVYLYAGSGIKDTSGNAVAAGTLLGTATFTGGAATTTATSTLSTVVQLPKDSDATITVKADLAGIGVGLSGGVGDVIKVDPLNAQSTGGSSGSTVWAATASTGASGVQMFKSYPTFNSSVTTGPTVPALPNGTDMLLKKFAITANAAGPVGVNQIAVSISTTSASVSNLKLFAYTDSGYSQPANVSGTTGGQFGGTASLNGTLDIAAPTVSFYQTTALQVPAGTSYYFAVKGTVTPSSATATTWTIATTVLGDAATSTAPDGYNATSTANRTSLVSGVATTTTGYDFIWSDNASTTAGVQDIDWFNGYAIPGLPGSGF